MISSNYSPLSWWERGRVRGFPRFIEQIRKFNQDEVDLFFGGERVRVLLYISTL